MDPDRSAEWAARVAAWHRRDPLARRVAPGEVGDVGWVDLPYAGAEDRARWRAVFSAPVAGLRASRVAAWALDHGQRARPEPAEPLQQVPIDRRLLPEQGEVALLWVGRATLRTPHGTTTVLVDPRPGGAVLGRRLRSRPRVAAAAAALAAVVGLTSGFAWVVANGRERPSAAGAPAAAVSAAVAASAPAGASAAASGVVSAAASAAASGVVVAAGVATGSEADRPTAVAAAGPASGAASAAGRAGVAVEPSARPVAAASAPSRATFAAVAAASVGAPASAPASREPGAAGRPAPAEARGPALAPAVEPVVTTGRIVEDRPVFLDEADRIAARATGEAARAAAAARRIARHPVAWALAGPPLRTPAEAQLAGRDLAKALAAAGAGDCPRIDPMPAGDDWRMVCWPFVRRADGEKLRAALGPRGSSLQLIEF